MGLGEMLTWSQTTRDGTRRSALANFMDPVGVCVEPAVLDPFVAPEAPALPSDSSDEADPSAAAAGASQPATRMDYAEEALQRRQLRGPPVGG